MHAFVLGGSKNIGYYAALRLLEQGNTVTFLLRRTTVFDYDEQMQHYLKKGQATLVAGDGLNLADCRGDEAERTGKAPYRAVAGEIEGGYTVSRRDTAHFIVNGVLKDWEKWEGKGVVLVY
ncbi:hypothetical protein BN946_scf184843.g16 [Trametes cinnabarina]|uniref:NAD(P)-binding domain-containing protein n=1 Tax=Pycnoporus cinnabarinus TaxID=5643 RepID=A0A060S794_PYCCI|nr:hypothetical protein BN946_scf184843.g16 [Trametes cinnabarina]